MHANVYRLPQPRFDTAAFNRAAQAFFEHWRPQIRGRGRMPVPMILERFDTSRNGYLVACYRDPLAGRVEHWGLDVPSYMAGRKTPRRLQG